MIIPDNIPDEWRQPLAGFDTWADVPGGAWFDVEAAEATCQWFPDHLKLKEGEYAGQPFELEPWQRLLVGFLFGWKMADGIRRFNELLLYIARKNGKTTLAAGLVLLLFTSDGEDAAQVFCAAADTDQAAIVFGEAKSMVEQDEEMSDLIKILPSYRTMKFGNSILRVLSSVAGTKHGLNLSAFVVDELHAQKDDRLVEALETGTASRRQPLSIYLTTADHVGDSICNSKLEYAEKVRDGIISQPHMFPVIFKAEDSDDWRDLATWQKANPNYGVSLKPAYAKQKIAKALVEPSFLPSLKRLHLNIQTNKRAMWSAMGLWGDNAGAFTEADTAGHPCFGGLDLSSVSDITAFVLYWPHINAVFSRFYVPEEAAEKNVHYLPWVADGHMQTTPGNRIDYEYIRADILEANETHNITDVGYDRWNADQLVLKLTETDGLRMVEFGQGYRDMSPPAKELERILLGKELKHNGNPVLYWMASNTAISEDPAGNIKPVKPKRTNSIKIDGIVGLVMAIGRSMAAPTQSYAEQGIVVTI